MGGRETGPIDVGRMFNKAALEDESAFSVRSCGGLRIFLAATKVLAATKARSSNRRRAGEQPVARFRQLATLRLRPKTGSIEAAREGLFNAGVATLGISG
jgi:hypothetical protein